MCWGAFFPSGASGRVEGCDIRGYSQGWGIGLAHACTSLLVSCNTIRDGKEGVHILSTVSPSWTLGEGDIFTNCAEGDVVDERGQEEGEEEEEEGE